MRKDRTVAGFQKVNLFLSAAAYGKQMCQEGCAEALKRELVTNNICVCDETDRRLNKNRNVRLKS